MDERPGAESAPMVARLVRPPNTPFPQLFGRAFRAALRSPMLGLGLGGAVLLARAGWAVALLLIFQASLGEGGLTLASALGMGVVASLFATVVELTLWSGGIPVLAERMRDGVVRPFGEVFTRGVERAFATMLGIGLYRVLAWLFFQFAGFGLFFALVVALIASPALMLLGIPLVLLFVAGELLWRILAWIAIARVGSLEEGFLPAFFAGLRQFFARPTAHLLTWWAGNLAISFAGGGVAALAVAGLGGTPTLGAALFTLAASLVVGMVLLVVMSIYTALSLDAVPPQATR